MPNEPTAGYVPAWKVVAIFITAVTAIAAILSWQTAQHVRYQADLIEDNCARASCPRPSDCRVAPDERTQFILAAVEVNPELAKCAGRMEVYGNWRLILAIAGAETDYCRAGVGRRNNCGGIRSSVPGRAFKIYETKCDGLEDIGMVLAKPAYDGLTFGTDLDALSGIWCGDGPECATWAEAVAQRIPVND